MGSFTATVADGSSEPFVATFEPAPADERPSGETAGCSHYVAKTPLMGSDSGPLTVSATLTIHGKQVAAVWKGFTPRKYAHHVD